MKRNNRFIFVVTCLIFTISYSGLFGTVNLNRQLNIFVNENNLSHSDIQQILSELNNIEYTKYNKELKKGLKKIRKLKEKELEKGIPLKLRKEIRHDSLLTNITYGGAERDKREGLYKILLKNHGNILRLRE